MNRSERARSHDTDSQHDERGHFTSPSRAMSSRGYPFPDDDNGPRIGQFGNHYSGGYDPRERDDEGRFTSSSRAPNSRGSSGSGDQADRGSRNDPYESQFGDQHQDRYDPRERDDEERFTLARGAMPREYASGSDDDGRDWNSGRQYGGRYGNPYRGQNGGNPAGYNDRPRDDEGRFTSRSGPMNSPGSSGPWASDGDRSASGRYGGQYEDQYGGQYRTQNRDGYDEPRRDEEGRFTYGSRPASSRGYPSAGDDRSSRSGPYGNPYGAPFGGQYDNRPRDEEGRFTSGPRGVTSRWNSSFNEPDGGSRSGPYPQQDRTGYDNRQRDQEGRFTSSRSQHSGTRGTSR